MRSLIVGTQVCHCHEPNHVPRLVAITGGPGGGKSAVLGMASRVFCRHVAILPESASIVFGGGFPRHSTLAGERAAQRAIFAVQREVERLVREERRVAVALCDRGTIDGLAYWPDSPEAYWEELGTTLEAELSRYSAVIHLETPELSQGYNHENALRIESAEEASSIDGRIAAAWQLHPRRFVVSSRDDFLDKALLALQLIRDQLPPCCHRHQLDHLGGAAADSNGLTAGV